MKVALTGGTGLLGGVLVPKLLAAGHEVRALARPKPGRELPAADGLEWVLGSLHEPAPLRELVLGADSILHGAWLHPEEGGVNDWSVAETYVQSNFAGTMRLLEHTPGLGAKQLVYTSTLAVFGHDPDDDPRGERFARDEDFPLWPTQFYGAMRAAVEKLVIASAHCYGLNNSVFRLGCVLGDRADLDGIVLLPLIREALRDGVIRSCLGAYVLDVEDTADLLVDAIGDEGLRGRVFNTFHRWEDFTRLAPLLSELLGREVTVACPPANEPRSPIRGDALHARYDRWRTDEKLPALVRRLVERVQAGE